MMRCRLLLMKIYIFMIHFSILTNMEKKRESEIMIESGKYSWRRGVRDGRLVSSPSSATNSAQLPDLTGHPQTGSRVTTDV